MSRWHTCNFPTQPGPAGLVQQREQSRPHSSSSSRSTAGRIQPLPAAHLLHGPGGDYGNSGEHGSGLLSPRPPKFSAAAAPGRHGFAGAVLLRPLVAAALLPPPTSWSPGRAGPAPSRPGGLRLRRPSRILRSELHRRPPHSARAPIRAVPAPSSSGGLRCRRPPSGPRPKPSSFSGPGQVWPLLGRPQKILGSSISSPAGVTESQRMR